jgi:hypothetical protein
VKGFRNEYRVVPRWGFANPERVWYGAQCRRWWFPVWVELDYYETEDEAAAKCRKHARDERELPPVRYLGRLP